MLLLLIDFLHYEWHKFGAMLLDTCKDHLETHGGDYAGENITVEVGILCPFFGPYVLFLKCILFFNLN